MFNQDTADQICAGLAEGKSLRAVCDGEGMPAASTVIGWVQDNKDFSEQYTRARSGGYQLLADQILEISDYGSGDVARDRLSVDSRKWMLSKMLPKVYGDKVEQTLQVGDSITKIVREIIESE